MSGCRCETGLGNLGVPSCPLLLQYAEKMILVPKYGSDGSLNRIDLTDTINDAYITDKINALDPADRWYFTPSFVEFAPTQADSVFQERNTGKKSFVREGVQSVSLVFDNQTSQWLGKIKNYRCSEFGVYFIHHDGNLTGDIFTAGFLSPVPVDNQTWNPLFQQSTPSTVSDVLLTFDLSLDHKDELFGTIKATEVAPANLLSYTGLLDVYAAYSNITTTGVTVTLTTSYGSVLNPDVVPNLVKADFKDNTTTPGTPVAERLYNVTDSLAITILTSTENPDGSYALTHAAQTAADVIKVQPIKNGLDFSAVVAKTYSI